MTIEDSKRQGDRGERGRGREVEEGRREGGAVEGAGRIPSEEREQELERGWGQGWGERQGEEVLSILKREHEAGIDHIPINQYFDDRKQEWNKTPYRNFPLEQHYRYELHSTLEELERYHKEYGCISYARRLGRLRSIREENGTSSSTTTATASASTTTTSPSSTTASTTAASATTSAPYLVGIDCDDGRFASLIDRFLCDHGLDTMKERTPRGGMHFYFLIHDPEGVRKGLNFSSMLDLAPLPPAATTDNTATTTTTTTSTATTTNTAADRGDNKDRTAAANANANTAANATIDIKLYLEKRYFIFLGRGYSIINGIDRLKVVDRGEDTDTLISLLTRLRRIISLILLLSAHYIEGKRDHIWFYLSGYMCKRKIDLNEALEICRYVCTYFQDREMNSRLRVIEDTYRDHEQGKDVKGIQGLAELGISLSGISLERIFPSPDNGNSRRRRRREAEDDGDGDGDGDDLIRELSGPLAKKIQELRRYNRDYQLITALLMQEYMEGTEDARFIDDYRFVMYDVPLTSEERREGGYWIKWMGYVWRRVNDRSVVKVLDQYLMRKIEELEKEKIDVTERIRKKEHDLIKGYSDKEIRALISLMESVYDECMEYIHKGLSSDSRSGELLRTMEISPHFPFVIYEHQLDGGDAVDDTESTTGRDTDSADSAGWKKNRNRNYRPIIINTRSHLLIWDWHKRDFTAIPHAGGESKRYYMTRAIDAEYDPHATCSKFTQFLYEICSNDMEKARFLITLAALTLMKRRHEYFIVFYGTGQNGKSTFVKVITDILHDYARFSNVSMINAREEEGKNPELIASMDKNLVCILEPKQVYLNSANVKAVSALEPKAVRTLHRIPVEILPDFWTWLSTNNKPVVDDFTLGMFRRLIMVEFDHIIPEHKRIECYERILLDGDEAVTEETGTATVAGIRGGGERNGIFMLMLRALKEYLCNGMKLIVPDCVKRSTARWLWELDLLQEFLDRKTEMTYSDKDRIPFALLYERFSAFCRDKGLTDEEFMSKREFSKRLKDKGYDTVKSKKDKVTYVTRIRWKEDHQQQQADDDYGDYRIIDDGDDNDGDNDGNGGSNSSNSNSNSNSSSNSNNSNSSDNTGNGNSKSDNSNIDVTAATTTAITDTAIVVPPPSAPSAPPSAPSAPPSAPSAPPSAPSPSPATTAATVTATAPPSAPSPSPATTAATVTATAPPSAPSTAPVTAPPVTAESGSVSGSETESSVSGSGWGTDRSAGRYCTVKDMVQVIECLQKNFADYDDGMYLCRRCDYSHAPAVLCSRRVSIQDLPSIERVPEDHELIAVLQDLVYHAHLHDYQEWERKRYPEFEYSSSSSNSSGSNSNSGSSGSNSSNSSSSRSSSSTALESAVD